MAMYSIILWPQSELLIPQLFYIAAGNIGGFQPRKTSLYESTLVTPMIEVLQLTETLRKVVASLLKGALQCLITFFVFRANGKKDVIDPSVIGTGITQK